MSDQRPQDLLTDDVLRLIDEQSIARCKDLYFAEIHTKCVLTGNALTREIRRLRQENSLLVSCLEQANERLKTLPHKADGQLTDDIDSIITQAKEARPRAPKPAPGLGPEAIRYRDARDKLRGMIGGATTMESMAALDHQTKVVKGLAASCPDAEREVIEQT